MGKKKSSIILFLLFLTLLTFPVHASEETQNLTDAAEIETYSDATAVSLSTKISPSISIIVTPDTMSFGKLSSGTSSEPHTLTIFNKGSSKTYVTCEVIDVANDLFADGMELDGDSWAQYERQISRDGYIKSNVQLNVPEDFVGLGSMEGMLIFWAEPNENNVPVLEKIGDISVNSSDIVKIVLHASDSDDDKLTYSTTAEFGNLDGNVFEWNTTGTEAGDYKVAFCVSDGHSTDSETIVITIKNGTDDFSPIVNFTANVTKGKIPLTVMFTDQSMNVTSWEWDFGDGTYSSDRNAVHTYTEAGTYTVSLEAGNNSGNSTEEKADYIIAYPQIIINLISPSSSYITDQVGASRLFEVATDEVANITWILDNVSMQVNSSSMKASYYCSSAEEGLHNLTIIAENMNGTAQSEWTWNVTSSSSSVTIASSSSSGSSVRGGGSYGEDSDNICNRVSLTQKVLVNKLATYSFDSKDNPISSVSFIALENSGVVCTTIEMLKGISVLVSGPPSGDVYQYMNIWVGDTGFATQDHIEDAVVSFKVEKSWVSDNGIQSSQISLCRYNSGEWKELDTQKVDEDDDYIYFEAATPGFSPFAITAVNDDLTSVTTSKEGISSSNDFSNIEFVSNDASLSGIGTLVWVLFMVLMLAGAGIYSGERKGYISLSSLSERIPSLSSISEKIPHVRSLLERVPPLSSLSLKFLSLKSLTLKISSLKISSLGSLSLKSLSLSSFPLNSLSLSSISLSFSSLTKKKSGNVIFKDILSCEIDPVGFTSYNFDSEENPVGYVNLKAKDYIGNVKVKVEVLRKRSLLVNSNPPGKVYRHLNIWIIGDGFCPLAIDSPSVGFKVERTWLKEKGIDPSSVSLLRYADEMWQKLPTSIVKDTGDALIFESHTPGFSSFAICSD